MVKVGKIRGILLAFALVALCGCSSRPSQLWSFAMPEQTVLVSNTGKVVWQGNGEAVRNPWGNFVVTDWTPAEPVQIVVSSEGKILVEGQPGQQLMQVTDSLIALQQPQELWHLSVPGGKEYNFERADTQPNGDVLLCGLQEGGSVRLNSKGEEVQRFSQNFLWASSGLQGWYESPNGDTIDLLDPHGKTVYTQVQRMVGQGRALIKQPKGYGVIQVEDGKKLYEGQENWRLYLDELQLEQQQQGFLIQGQGEDYWADLVNTWPYSGEAVYYMARGKEVEALWTQKGEQLFVRPVSQWSEILDEDSVAGLSDGILTVTDQHNKLQWKLEGCSTVWVEQGEQGAVLCVIQQDQPEKTHIYQQDGTAVVENLQAVYEVTPQGIACQKDGENGVLDWQGNWIFRLKKDV